MHGLGPPCPPKEGSEESSNFDDSSELDDSKTPPLEELGEVIDAVREPSEARKS